jgi:hypothetical protein
LPGTGQEILGMRADRGDNMCSRIAVLAAMLAVAPLGAKAADLVVWWEMGSNPEEDAAVREIIAAFERETGKQVDLEQRRKATSRPRPLPSSPTGKTPDFLFGTNGQWAGAGRLIEHSDVVRPFSSVRLGRLRYLPPWFNTLVPSIIVKLPVTPKRRPRQEGGKYAVAIDGSRTGGDLDVAVRLSACRQGAENGSGLGKARLWRHLVS